MKTLILTTLLITSPAFAGGETPLDLAEKCIDMFGPNQTLEQTYLCSKIGTSKIVEPPKKPVAAPTCLDIANTISCDSDQDCYDKIQAAAEKAAVNCDHVHGGLQTDEEILYPGETPIDYEKFYECEVY